MDTNLSTRATLLPLISIFGIVLIYFFGFTRGLEGLATAAQQRKANDEEITALRQRITDLRALEQEFARRQDEVRALTVAMPSEKQMAELVSMFESMAGRAGVILETFQPGQGATPEGLPLTVSVRGTFGGTLALIEVMEKNVRPLTIRKINVATGNLEEGSLLTTTFELIALYQVPATDLTTEEASAEEAQ